MSNRIKAMPATGMSKMNIQTTHVPEAICSANEREVPAALSATEDYVSILEKLTSDLEDRLYSSVCHPSPVDPDIDKADIPSSTPLASTIMYYNDRMRKLSHRLQSLLSGMQI
jgi:hypothetical protein